LDVSLPDDARPESARESENYLGPWKKLLIKIIQEGGKGEMNSGDSPSSSRDLDPQRKKRRAGFHLILFELGDQGKLERGIHIAGVLYNQGWRRVVDADQSSRTSFKLR